MNVRYQAALSQPYHEFMKDPLLEISNEFRFKRDIQNISQFALGILVNTMHCDDYVVLLIRDISHLLMYRAFETVYCAYLTFACVNSANMFVAIQGARWS